MRRNGHKGEYECFHQCQRGSSLDIWLSLMFLDSVLLLMLTDLVFIDVNRCDGTI
jgi:hypothetical protein